MKLYDFFCDDCLDVAYDNGIEDTATVMMILGEMGAEMEDHDCIKFLEPDLNFRCDCACNKS